jgi:hypothetical protein
MKSKFLHILPLLPLCFLLTACTSKDSTGSTDPTVPVSNETPAEEKTVTQSKQVTIDQVLSEVGLVTGLSDPMEMRLRRTVDSYSLDDEGKGYTVRAATGDQRFVQWTDIIREEMRSLGFTVAEATPKNADSLVTKFIKYGKGGIKCTVEVRKVGTSGQSDFTFGCL